VRYRIKLHGDLTVFKMTAIRHLGFLKLEFLTVGTIKRGSMCVIVQNFVIIGQTIPDIWRVFDIFKNGDRPPSWICYEEVWTTHKDYLMVFITAQNFVGIDAVCFDNMQVLIFNDFGYRQRAEGGPSHGHRQHAQKFGKIW